MNIYKIIQEDNVGYDTFDSAVVIASSAKKARTIHPEGLWNNELILIPLTEVTNYTWTNDPMNVTVEYIGKAAKSFKKATIINASFNAG